MEHASHSHPCVYVCSNTGCRGPLHVLRDIHDTFVLIDPLNASMVIRVAVACSTALGVILSSLDDEAQATVSHHWRRSVELLRDMKVREARTEMVTARAGSWCFCVKSVAADFAEEKLKDE